MKDDIYTSTPVNKTAAMVTGSGEHFEYTPKDGHELISKTPLKIVPIKYSQRNNPTFIDYTGCRKGRLSVIGLGEPAKNGARWVVRCDCSNYTYRKTKSLNGIIYGTDSVHLDACAECKDMIHIKRHYQWLKTGKDVDSSEFY